MEEQLAGYVSGLYEEHYAGLFRHLILSGSTAAEADDLIQEGFLRLFRHLGSGHPVDNPRWWLVKVMHNLRIDDIRKRKREFALDQPELTSMIEQMRTTGPDAEAEIIAREEQVRVQKAISRLAPRQYQYLLLRAEGLKLREIAEMFRVTVQTGKIGKDIPQPAFFCFTWKMNSMDLPHATYERTLINVEPADSLAKSSNSACRALSHSVTRRCFLYPLRAPARSTHV